MQKLRLKPPTWLRALGRNGLPAEIVINRIRLGRRVTFKHDFFAATGAYGDDKARYVLKIGREARLIGLPVRWIGLLLTRREMTMLAHVQDVRGIPRLAGTWRETGLVREAPVDAPPSASQPSRR